MGTIIAWILAPTKNSTSPGTIPKGWTKCDGGIINEGRWAGQLTPNINNDHRFLRGGSDAEQLELEDDMIHDHEHEDAGHTHNQDPHHHTYSKYTNEYHTTKIDYDSACCTHRTVLESISQKSSSEIVSDIAPKISKVASGIGKVVDIYKRGDETRPKNLKVTFLMRTS